MNSCKSKRVSIRDQEEDEDFSAAIVRRVSLVFSDSNTPKSPEANGNHVQGEDEDDEDDEAEDDEEHPAVAFVRQVSRSVSQAFAPEAKIQIPPTPPTTTKPIDLSGSASAETDEASAESEDGEAEGFLRSVSKSFGVPEAFKDKAEDYKFTIVGADGDHVRRSHCTPCAHTNTSTCPHLGRRADDCIHASICMRACTTVRMGTNDRHTCTSSSRRHGLEITIEILHPMSYHVHTYIYP